MIAAPLVGCDIPDSARTWAPASDPTCWRGCGVGVWYVCIAPLNIQSDDAVGAHIDRATGLDRHARQRLKIEKEIARRPAEVGGEAGFVHDPTGVDRDGPRVCVTRQRGVVGDRPGQLRREARRGLRDDDRRARPQRSAMRCLRPDVQDSIRLPPSAARSQFGTASVLADHPFTSSTRRLRARPSMVSLRSFGRDSP